MKRVGSNRFRIHSSRRCHLSTRNEVLPMSPEWTRIEWRRERDSNPRYGFPYSGFQDRLFQPLTHPSTGGETDVHAIPPAFPSAIRCRGEWADNHTFEKRCFPPRALAHGSCPPPRQCRKKCCRSSTNRSFNTASKKQPPPALTTSSSSQAAEKMPSKITSTFQSNSRHF